MRKNSIWMLGAAVLTVIASLMLILFVAPVVGAADNIVTLDQWEDFDINDDGELSGLSVAGKLKAGTAQLKISIPEGVVSIKDGTNTGSNDGAFYDYRNQITAMDFPSTLQKVGKYMIYKSESLVSVDFSKCTNLETIGASAFSDCTALSGELDFSHCPNLTELAFGSFKATAITSVDFAFCDKLQSIGGSAFFNCESLTAIKNLAHCTNLTAFAGIYAIHKCPALTYLELPASLEVSGTGIGDNAAVAVVIAANPEIAETYKTSLPTAYRNKVTYAVGLDVELTNEKGVKSVYGEKWLDGDSYTDWHYVNGAWVTETEHKVAALPTLPKGYVWQDEDGQELTADRVQELLTEAESENKLMKIKARAVGNGGTAGQPGQSGNEGKDDKDQAKDDTDYTWLIVTCLAVGVICLAAAADVMFVLGKKRKAKKENQ